MGRIADISSGKTSVGGGRLSGIVSSESAVNEKNNYYLDVEKKNRYEDAIKKANKAKEEAQKADEDLKFWEGIAGIPKQIYQAGKETGAAIIDTASRTSPIEPIRNTLSGISSVVTGPSNVPPSLRYEQGVQESKGRKTLFEKVSGKDLTNEDGTINWDAGRQFIGRAAEAPTYVYAGAIKGSELVGKGLLSRILTRTVKSTPEAAINTGIQQFEQGNTENIGTNFLANALLLSGISNIAGEVRFSKDIAKKTIDDIESELGKISLSEKADIIESIKQGIEPEKIVENVRKVKNNKVNPDELASVINEKSVPDTSSPIHQEARKYANEDDFIKAQGTPLYHGTNADFKIFDKSKIGSATDEGLYGSGFYFGNSREFARIAPGGRGAKNIMEVYPSADAKLFDISKIKSKKEMADLLNISEDALVQDSNGIIRPTRGQSGQFTSHLQELGYDGAFIKRGAGSVETVIFEPSKIKTKSQLTDIWKEAHGKSDTNLPITEKPEVSGISGRKESVTAKKMNERFGKDEQLSTEYDVIKINNESDKAAELIIKDRDKAIKVAFNDSGSNTEKIAILNELFEKSVVENDHELSSVLFNRIKQLSTETAQSLNMFKALTEINPHYAYMSEVVSSRLNGVKISSGKISEILKKESKQSRVNKKISKQKNELKEILSSSVKFDKAQKVFNDLICK